MKVCTYDRAPLGEILTLDHAQSDRFFSYLRAKVASIVIVLYLWSTPNEGESGRKAAGGKP